VSSARRSVTLEVQPDAGVPRGVAFVAFNQPNTAVGELVDVAAVVTDLRVETL
jgi:hypothetical protein